MMIGDNAETNDYGDCEDDDDNGSTFVWRLPYYPISIL